jgi:uncharacterized protein YlzI (FlbEa/FlbD family)
MIILTTKSGKKIGVNVEQIATIESDRDVAGPVTKVNMTNGYVYVRETVEEILQIVVDQHFFGGDSNG